MLINVAIEEISVFLFTSVSFLKRANYSLTNFANQLSVAVGKHPWFSPWWVGSVAFGFMARGITSLST